MEYEYYSTWISIWAFRILSHILEVSDFRCRGKPHVPQIVPEKRGTPTPKSRAAKDRFVKFVVTRSSGSS